MGLVNDVSVARASLETVGAKARTLARHRLAGLPVPALWVVPSGEADLDGVVHQIPDVVGAGPWMLRSSAPDEDATGRTLAGQYHSERVDEAEGLLGALERVRSSGKDPMPVLVHGFVDGRASGVVFSRHPLQPGESALEAGLADQVTAGRGGAEVWTRDRSGAGWFGRPRRARRGPALLSSSAAAEILNLALRVEALAHGDPRDVEWVWTDSGPVILQDRSCASDPAVSNYFLPERFASGASPLGWSLLSPVIQRCAVDDALRFLGREGSLRGPSLLVRAEVPHLSREASTELFRHFPGRLLPDEVRLENARLRVPWLSRVLSGFPRLPAVVGTLIAEPDWWPPAHRRRWNTFLTRLDRALESAPLDSDYIDAADAAGVADVFDACSAWSESLLSLHRWSLIHAEIMWRFTGRERPDEPGHATARALSELAALGPDADLSEFLRCHGHRSAGIDPANVTWAESPDSVRALRRLLVGSERPATGDVSVLGGGWLPGPIRSWKSFVLDLREDQRHHWQRILSRLRAGCLRAGELLFESGDLASPDAVFGLERWAVLAALRGEPRIGRPRPWRGLVPVPSVRSSGPFMRGIGVSPGRARGRVCRVEGTVDLSAVRPGSILVTRAADPAWALAFGATAGLVQELGGLLSHAAILARESGLPAVMGVRGACGIFQNGDLVELDGAAGTVMRIQEPGSDG